MSLLWAMKTAEDQVKIGDHLYMFLSPAAHRAANTDCIIFGHAGLAMKLNLPPFRVPDSARLHFYTTHGQPHYTKPTKPLEWRGKKDQDIAAGGTCHNYVVVKGLGTHWSHSDKGKNDPSSYLAVRAAMDAPKDWHPHYVTVRNRRGLFHGKGYCTLAEIVTSVLHYSKQQGAGIPPITDFYFAGCRGIENDWLPT